jgi:hypothetical protein
MTMMSWILVAAWIPTILVVINDLVDWQMRPILAQDRMRRGAIVMFSLYVLTGFALASVLLPYIL